ncbi:ulp1 protease family, C-terminal catalytic domain-containing protein, partial [Tanacetum coccineum]
ETVFETTSGEEKVLGIRLNMETLSPGLCIDANVVDCWAEILNYEDRFRKDGSLSRHFFPTGCITKSMFDGTLSTYEEKWKSFAAEVSAQFKDNVGGLALSGIDLAFFPICFSGHFYVVVFSITNTTSMTILDNMDSGATYDSKYKQPCDLLKKLFASHLRLYGHERHSKIGRLKARIPKLKWKTKANVKDYGIFSMLHMESYMGQTAKTWDCGLVAESKQQCDMLRQLRFKFATKILLHEINVHAQKMIRYAEEFDKIMGFQKMCIVVDALKNREEREKN